MIPFSTVNIQRDCADENVFERLIYEPVWLYWDMEEDWRARYDRPDALPLV